MSVHIYAGPTLAREEILSILPGASLHPPVAHGDLLRGSYVAGDIVVIIDGYYHHRAPVRHKEILHLLAQGVCVIGCSSMGALRAAELRHHGMVGAGTVFHMYADGIIDRDDEVAVVHTAPPECRRLSDALVAIRHAAACAATAGTITATEAERLAAAAGVLPYSLRSLAALSRESDAGGSLRGIADKVASYVAQQPDARDIKAADARSTLANLGALAASGDAAAIAALRTSEAWRTSHLQRWCGEFDGEKVRGRPISRSSLLRHGQIYRRSFPHRWRSYVLRQICPHDSPASTLPELALSMASARGIDWELLTADAREEWLLPDEITGLSKNDRMVTILVRSFRHGPGADRRLESADLLPSGGYARQLRVMLCLAYNDFMSRQHPTWHITHLRAEAIAEHLTRAWKLPASSNHRTLQAAARDRGFAGLPDAISAARPFYLLENMLHRTMRIRRPRNA